MFIDNFNLDEKVLIIAEIGNNHEGDYDIAKDMIHLAAKSGVDAVKFQTFIPEKLVSINQRKRVQQLKKFQLSYNEIRKLQKAAKRKNLLFLSTPFDIESAQFLNNIVPAFKIASGDINFYPMIETIAKTGKPIIMSTGLSETNQIAHTKRFIEKIWDSNNVHQELALLHCVTSYPTPLNDANLLSIPYLKEKFGCTIGYSDHTIGIDAAVVAVALGARIIEKHFTLDKNYSDFHDHKLSADPAEMAFLIKKITTVNEMLGNRSKDILACEKELRDIVHRSIAAKNNLNKGTAITSKDITWVRPGAGLPPGKENLLIGKKLIKDIKAGESITLDLLEDAI